MRIFVTDSEGVERVFYNNLERKVEVREFIILHREEIIEPSRIIQVISVYDDVLVANLVPISGMFVKEMK